MNQKQPSDPEAVNEVIKVVTWEGDYPENAFNAKSITFEAETEYDISTLLDEIKTEIEEAGAVKIHLKVHKMCRKKFNSLNELD